jgi:hypothetical protein
MKNHDDGIIDTGKLTKSDVPVGRINWLKFSKFALTFDPKKENLNEREMVEIGLNRPNSTQDIKVLRAILYNRQRIQNNKTDDPPCNFFNEMRDLMKLIYDKLDK